MTQAVRGEGPGTITPDGCAVELYRRIPARGEPEIILAAVPAGSTVLELGSGTGRVTRHLVAAGLDVIAVDESAEMLAQVTGARTVLSAIETLDLGQSVDAVLLCSHLLNVPDDEHLHTLLAAARRHLATGGVLVVEWHPPTWFDTAAEGGGRVGDVTVALQNLRRDGDLLSATVSYTAGDDEWRQHFTCRRLTEDAVAEALREADLEFEAWLTEDHGWFTARADTPR